MPKDFEIKRKVLIKYNGKSKNPVIPEGVEKIGKSAFEVAEIDSVTIPETVKEIGEDAFRGSDIREIEIPEDMPRASGILSGSAIKKAELLPTETEIKDFAFIGCWKLREITIPEGVTKIGYGAFSTCESLRKIVLPEGLEEICDKAFYGCRNLRTVVVPKSLKYVGAGAFADCPNLGVRTISKLEGKGKDIYAEDAWD